MSQFKGNTLPIDPDVSIPAAVRRAAAAADAAMAPPAPEAPQPPPAPSDTITLAPPPEPQRLPNQRPLVITDAPQPPAQQQPAPQPPAQPAEGTVAEWKNRYESMLGRFREANAQLIQANARTEALETMLATMQSAPQPPQPQTTAPLKFLTKKDEEDMGPEMIDFVQRAARELAAPIEAELNQLKNQLRGTVQEQAVTARERMHQDLDLALPSWGQINHDPEFHAWLALQDAFSGVNRKKLLTQAYAQNNTARVLAIFKGFVSETAAQPPVSPSTVPTPASVQPDRPTLEQLAAPGRARTAATPQVPGEKQIIRTSDVNAFYAAVRRGDYKGREELQKQHEQELFAAMQEGRVVTNT